jgi:hypothetical protein
MPSDREAGWIAKRSGLRGMVANGEAEWFFAACRGWAVDGRRVKAADGRRVKYARDTRNRAEAMGLDCRPIHAQQPAMRARGGLLRLRFTLVPGRSSPISSYGGLLRRRGVGRRGVVGTGRMCCEWVTDCGRRPTA